ncbi:helix-turn-helix domain-containing protein [Yinghuangia sp. YIM S09857]|uniref:helix-turn-helix domain-containing protein n=1 Tax=Yinghuangia sp. YIM S09857 TaxID=3436929 RepID=UPI003F52E591
MHEGIPQPPALTTVPGQPGFPHRERRVPVQQLAVTAHSGEHAFLGRKLGPGNVHLSGPRVRSLSVPTGSAASAESGRSSVVPAGYPARGEAPLPPTLLQNAEMRAACARRDIGTVFRLARDCAGISHSRLARLCDMTPSRISQYTKGRMQVRQQHVIERVADGLRIPGRMLGLACRPWETSAMNDR